MCAKCVNVLTDPANLAGGPAKCPVCQAAIESSAVNFVLASWSMELQKTLRREVGVKVAAPRTDDVCPLHPGEPRDVVVLKESKPKRVEYVCVKCAEDDARYPPQDGWEKLGLPADREALLAKLLRIRPSPTDHKDGLLDRKAQAVEAQKRLQIVTEEVCTDYAAVVKRIVKAVREHGRKVQANVRQVCRERLNALAAQVEEIEVCISQYEAFSRMCEEGALQRCEDWREMVDRVKAARADCRGVADAAVEKYARPCVPVWLDAGLTTGEEEVVQQVVRLLHESTVILETPYKLVGVGVAGYLPPLPAPNAKNYVSVVGLDREEHRPITTEEPGGNPWIYEGMVDVSMVARESDSPASPLAPGVEVRPASARPDSSSGIPFEYIVPAGYTSKFWLHACYKGCESTRTEWRGFGGVVPVTPFTASTPIAQAVFGASTLASVDEQTRLVFVRFMTSGVWLRELTTKSRGLLYRSSRDGLSSSAFRKACFGKAGASLVLVRSSNGFVFGGFLGRGWEAAPKPANIQPGKYDAFLFSVVGPFPDSEASLTRFPLKPKECVRMDAFSGPRFGNDLRVDLDGREYSCGLGAEGGLFEDVSGCGHKSATFTGQSMGDVEEVEVFSLDQRKKGPNGL